jgi:4-hydroxybenzoate polyprenyltransferase
VAEHVTLEPALLPYREDLRDYLREQRANGRVLILATGAHRSTAQAISAHVGLFERVYASDETTNLAGGNKRDRLVAEYGERGFDYAGDSRRDMPVWAAARRALLVDPFPALNRAVTKVTRVERVFEEQPASFAMQIRALRLRQWVKNALLFVPLLSAQRFDAPELLLAVMLGFVAFGLCASGTYLMNDLLDLPSDRRHPRKRHRPFAAGTLPLRWGLFMSPLLIAAGLVFASALPAPFAAIVIAYLGTTLLYSLYVKTVPMLDVIVLSSLYTIRLMAGSAAVDIWPSHWLLGASTFLFLSLAMVKRYGELTTVSETTAGFRGYRSEDGALLLAFGTASGYLAVLVLALYIATETAQLHYERYRLVWLICPLLTYWISHIWLTAHRRGMDDDPLVFALKDKTSLTALGLMGMVFLFAI